MKGITPVVAIILLLLITVSMVGFAFVWFTRISTLASEKIENRTEALLTTKSIRIENARGTTVDIRNTGDVVIRDAELAFYVSDVRQAGTTCPASIAPNAVVSCTLPGAGCPAGSRLRITVTGGLDVITCT